MTPMVYLDFNATTPLEPAVLDQMLPWMRERFWNAASSHVGGRTAAEAVDQARGQLAELIGARPQEIVWTSGATEANNLAIKGVAELARPLRRRVLTVATEHKAVLDTIDWLSTRGVPITILPVDSDGVLQTDQLEAELAAQDVVLVSVMAANNETGVMVDIPRIADLVHEHGALLHSDATQVVGKAPFDARSSGVDLASLSAHKIYGPKGVGALFVSRRTELAPLIHGGGHERGLRSGTVNVPGVIGFGAAAVIARNLLGSEPQRQRRLTDSLLTELRRLLEGVENTSAHTVMLPNTANVRIVDADAEAVMVNAPEVAVSSGSACTALVPAPSHVLLAMGLDHAAALECIRFSVGRSTTEEDVVLAADLIATAAQRVRALNG
jgi:cysteine desulfurase